MHFHVRQKYTLQHYTEEAVMVKRKRRRRKTLQLESKKCKKDFKRAKLLNTSHLAK